MANDYYNHGGYPSTNAAGDSASLRTELSAIAAGFAKLPPLLGANDEVVHVNATGDGLESSPFATLLSGLAALALTGTLSVAGATSLSSLNVAGDTTLTGATTLESALTGTTGSFSGALSGSLVHKRGGGYLLLGTFNPATYGDGDAKLWWREDLKRLTVQSSTGTDAQFRTGYLDATLQHRGPPADSAAAPGYSWETDAATGLYRADPSTIGVSVGGSGTWFFTPSGSFANTLNPPTFGSIGKLSVAGTTATFTSSFVLSRTSNDASGPVVRFGKSRSTAIGGYDAVQQGDDLGALIWYGADGVDGNGLAARIRAIASEAHTTAKSGAYLDIGTTAVGTNTFASRLTLDETSADFSVKVKVTENGSTGLAASTSGDTLVLDVGSGHGGLSILTQASNVGYLLFGSPTNVARGQLNYNHTSDTMALVVASGSKLILTSSEITANVELTLADVTPTSALSAGFRGMPTLGNTATATKAAVGKCYLNTGNITINNSVFAAGDVFCVYNNSAAAITIVDGTITTMRLGGTATTGSRTLAARGLATLFFPTATECVVSGTGVS